MLVVCHDNTVEDTLCLQQIQMAKDSSHRHLLLEMPKICEEAQIILVKMSGSYAVEMSKHSDICLAAAKEIFDGYHFSAQEHLVQNPFLKESIQWYLVDKMKGSFFLEHTFVSNPCLSESVIRHIYKNWRLQGSIFKVFLNSANIPLDIQKEMLNQGYLIFLTGNKHIFPEIATRTIDQSDSQKNFLGKGLPQEIYNLVFNEALPLNLQKKILDKFKEKAAYFFLCNPDIPVELIIEITKLINKKPDQKNVEILSKIIEHPRTPQEIKNEIIKEHFQDKPIVHHGKDIEDLERLRQYTTEHSDTQEELDSLVKKSASEINPWKKQGPWNAKTLQEQRLYLRQGEVERWHLANNPYILPEIQIELIMNSDEKNYNHYCYNRNIYKLEALAENKALTEKAQNLLLDKAEETNNWEIIYSLSENPSIVESTQKRLFEKNDMSEYVTMKLARNPGLVPELQKEFALFLLDLNKPVANRSSVAKALVCNSNLCQEAKDLILRAIVHLRVFDQMVVTESILKNPSFSSESKKTALDNIRRSDPSVHYHPDMEPLEKMRHHLSEQHPLSDEIDSLLK